MDPQAVAALIQLGVAGVFLYAFLADKLRTKTASDERIADADARLAEVRVLYETRIKEYADRLRDERATKNEWKALALGTERRLDQVTPLVATAVGAPVLSAGPTEAST